GDLVGVPGPHRRCQGQAGPGGRHPGPLGRRVPLRTAQAGAAARRVRADRADAGEAGQVQRDPLRPLQGGDPLRPRPEPGHGRVAEAATYRSGVEAYLDVLIDQVKLIDKSETKLSGRSATIPVTVQNNLVQGVEHLVLRLSSTNPTRLEIGGAAYAEQPVTVSGGHSQSVKFPTSANANGRATVVAQLFTEDGRPYGEPVVFDVKVTEITATVMLVIGGGVLLLVLAGFRMYTQRKRAAARRAEDEPDGTDE